MSLNAWVEATLSSVVREKGPPYGGFPRATTQRRPRKKKDRQG
jgi:hypothetical protein